MRTDIRTRRRESAPLGAANVGSILEAMTSSTKKTLGARARAWAKLSAAYSNGDHFGVSGQDALRARATRKPRLGT